MVIFTPSLDFVSFSLMDLTYSIWMLRYFSKLDCYLPFECSSSTAEKDLNLVLYWQRDLGISRYSTSVVRFSIWLNRFLRSRSLDFSTVDS